MKLAISAGGTGGHLFPGIAVAEAWTKRSERNEVIFLGRRDGLEGRVIPKKGYRFFQIEAEGMVGKGAFGKIRSVLSLLLGTLRALLILKEERPSALLSFGAYTSVAPSLAAYLLKIPLFLHEQNVEPGIANRLLSPFARAVFVSFEDTRHFFPRKPVFVTGNPLRESLRRQKGGRKDGLFCLFVLGGSRGASSINALIAEALPLFEKEGGFFLCHQTGQEEYERMVSLYRSTSIPFELFPFREDIGTHYAQADLVLSRAGAMTIFEISFFKKPAILIPYPYAARRHQWVNAKHVERLGGAIVIEQAQADGQKIFETVRALRQDSKTLQEMGERMGTLCKVDAHEAIVDAIMDRLLRR